MLCFIQNGSEIIQRRECHTFLFYQEKCFYLQVIYAVMLMEHLLPSSFFDLAGCRAVSLPSLSPLSSCCCGAVFPFLMSALLRAEFWPTLSSSGSSWSWVWHVMGHCWVLLSGLHSVLVDCVVDQVHYNVLPNVKFPKCIYVCQVTARLQQSPSPDNL